MSSQSVADKSTELRPDSVSSDKQPEMSNIGNSNKMKAILNEQYGAPSELALKSIDKPKIGDDDVLVRVHSAGLHIGDCFSVRGKPFLMRLNSGLFKPAYGVPGFDVAGTVAAIGKNVSSFQVGDDVFGECNGSCAEFARVAEARLAHKPSNLGFEQAAAVPTSGLAALHALRDVAKVQSGQRVLVNGASGGVGTYAVQIAKLYGAQVTGVCSSANESLVRSIGADEVIDYTRDNFTQGDRQYDVIFDNIENRSLAECRRVLSSNGMLILNSGTGASGIRMLIRIVKPLLLSPFVKQNLRRFLSVPNHADLEVLRRWLASGELRPIIDKVYPLRETAAALEYIESGRARGKVIVTI